MGRGYQDDELIVLGHGTNIRQLSIERVIRSFQPETVERGRKWMSRHGAQSLDETNRRRAPVFHHKPRLDPFMIERKAHGFPLWSEGLAVDVYRQVHVRRGAERVGREKQPSLLLGIEEFSSVELALERSRQSLPTLGQRKVFGQQGGDGGAVAQVRSIIRNAANRAPLRDGALEQDLGAFSFIQDRQGGRHMPQSEPRAELVDMGFGEVAHLACLDVPDPCQRIGGIGLRIESLTVAFGHISP